MSQKFFQEEDEIVYPEESVTEVSRPNPGSWIAVFGIFLCVGFGLWYWYRNVSMGGSQPVVIGPAAPRPTVGRYVLVREGDRSRIVGGSEVMIQPGGGQVVSTRAESLASYTTNDVDTFTGPNPDLTRIGQTITVDEGRVHQATGDKTFSLHAGNGAVLLVFFPEPDTAKGDKAIRIVGGDTVDVTGTLRRMPPPAEAQRLFGLSKSEANQLTDGKLYLDAYRVAIR